MNWLDGVLSLVIVWSMVTAFRKGFTREIIGLASVVVGLLLGAWFYGTAASYLLPYVSSRAAANFAGFLLVFLVVLFFGAVVSFLVRKFLKFTGLSFFDRLLGAAFGFLRGGLIGVALVMGLMAFSPTDKPPASVVNSRLAPYVVDGARVVVTVAPHELKTGFQRTYDQVKTAWNAALEHEVRTGNGRDKKNEKSN